MKTQFPAQSPLDEDQPKCPTECRHRIWQAIKKAFPRSEVFPHPGVDRRPYTYYCRRHKAETTYYIGKTAKDPDPEPQEKPTPVQSASALSPAQLLAELRRLRKSV